MRAEIEQTKRDLAVHLSELQEEASASERRAMRVLAIGVGVLIAVRLAWFLWRRSRD